MLDSKKIDEKMVALRDSLRHELVLLEDGRDDTDEEFL